ncbi:hypothetical protein ACLOJK_036526 [Asimina triloba]
MATTNVRPAEKNGQPPKSDPFFPLSISTDSKGTLPEYRFRYSIFPNSPPSDPPPARLRSIDRSPPNRIFEPNQHLCTIGHLTPSTNGAATASVPHDQSLVLRPASRPASARQWASDPSSSRSSPAIVNRWVRPIHHQPSIHRSRRTDPSRHRLNRPTDFRSIVAGEETKNPAAIEDPSPAALRFDPSGSNPPLAADGEQSIDSHGRVRSRRPIQRSAVSQDPDLGRNRTPPDQRHSTQAAGVGDWRRHRAAVADEAPPITTSNERATPPSIRPQPTAPSAGHNPCVASFHRTHRSADPSRSNAFHQHPSRQHLDHRPFRPSLQLHKSQRPCPAARTIAHQISDLIYDPLSRHHHHCLQQRLCTPPAAASNESRRPSSTIQSSSNSHWARYLVGATGGQASTTRQQNHLSRP